MHIVNKQNPNLPRTPIYRGCLLSPKTRGKSGLNFIFYIVNVEVAYIHTALSGWNLETQKHLMTLFCISVLLSMLQQVRRDSEKTHSDSSSNDDYIIIPIPKIVVECGDQQR